MNEFLTTLLQAVLVAAVPVCAAFLGQGIRALAAYLSQKAENAALQKNLDAVADAVSTAVTYTSQTYVDALKKEDKFTPENQREALQKALAKAQSLLTEEARDFLQTAYGDLNEYLKSRIEAEVRNQKMGVGTLTLSA